MFKTNTFSSVQSPRDQIFKVWKGQNWRSPTKMGAKIPDFEQLAQSHGTHRVNPKIPRQNPTHFGAGDLPETLIWVDLDCLDPFLWEGGRATWSKHPSIGRDIRDKPREGWSNNFIHSAVFSFVSHRIRIVAFYKLNWLNVPSHVYEHLPAGVFLQ